MDDNRNIYLDHEGNYRDRTDENLEAHPPLETTADKAAEALPEGEPVPFTEDGKLDGRQMAQDVAVDNTGGTVGAGSEAPPVVSGPPTEAAPKGKGK